MGPANYAIGPSCRKQLLLLGVREQKEAVEIIKQIISKMGPLKCGWHLVLVSLSSEKGPCEAGTQSSENGCWSVGADRLLLESSKGHAKVLEQGWGASMGHIRSMK